MFVHQNQLEYQLETRHYYDQVWHQRELESLFEPSWHLVGTKADLPNEGDFFTLDLLGKPIIVRRENGFHAFLNVCSHRHCKLTSLECGNSEKLTCQYHGWEYKPDGFTSKIPDARCFRPFDRERAKLRKLRLETCGDLLFVNLSDNDFTLRDNLCELFDVVDEAFQSPFKQIYTWDYESKCNWKIAVENTIETYHLPQVHKGFFAGVYPSEGKQQHTLTDQFTTLRYDLSEDTRVVRDNKRTLRFLGDRKPTNIYWHHMLHPNIVFVISDVFLLAQVYIPLAPDRMWTRIRFFGYQGSKRNPLAWITQRIANFIGRRMIREIQTEDASIFEEAQKGIPHTPYQGCLGTREERIYAFQKYVSQAATKNRVNSHSDDAESMNQDDDQLEASS